MLRWSGWFWGCSTSSGAQLLASHSRGSCTATREPMEPTMEPLIGSTQCALCCWLPERDFGSMVLPVSSPSKAKQTTQHSTSADSRAPDRTSMLVQSQSTHQRERQHKTVCPTLAQTRRRCTNGRCRQRPTMPGAIVPRPGQPRTSCALSSPSWPPSMP